MATKGRRISQVTSGGKAMLIHFTGGLTIYSHNQLYGRWFVRVAGQYPRTKRSLRLEIRNRKKSALLYSASEIDVLDRSELGKHPYLSRLGPDILDRGTTPRVIQERFIAEPFVRRRLAALLLGQSSRGSWQLPALRDPLRRQASSRPHAVGSRRGRIEKSRKVGSQHQQSHVQTAWHLY
jgi:formamidopyrimidine-DNA glycosylase